MDRFENDLRGALRRREPPRGFSEKVFARAGTTPSPRKPPWKRRWLRIVAAAAAITLIIAVLSEHQRRQRVAAEKIKEQVLLALRITQSKLQTVEAHLINAQR